MNIPLEKIEEIKRQARRETASKGGKAGVKANIARIMQEHKFKTEEEAKSWYFSEIRKNRKHWPKKYNDASPK